MVEDLARAVLPQLPKLAGDKAPKLEAELNALLLRADHGEDVDAPILKLLQQEPHVEEWIAHKVSADFSKVPAPDVLGYISPVSGVGDISADRYACPRGDFVWSRADVGDEPPRCPNHGISLVPAEADG